MALARLKFRDVILSGISQGLLPTAGRPPAAAAAVAHPASILAPVFPARPEPAVIQSDVPALTVRNLHKRFAGGDWVVRDVSLEVRRGELLCILGPSGCGKTTLLRLIGGFEEPERGEVLTRGEVISRPGWVLPPEERKIGMVFQDYALFPHLRVRENVRFGLVPPLRRRLRAWLARSVRYRAADPTLRRWEHNRGLLRLTGLSELAERYPHELSGGQQQRVALA
ncbi:MAG: ABC transporter ATP-binding protein, partial [Candidatus Lambdaproteobacteria bacterium]|nr:ABC transporter ATP-binding protein [Candidatus Lambdaproteobacteria bacterium]